MAATPEDEQVEVEIDALIETHSKPLFDALDDLENTFRKKR